VRRLWTPRWIAVHLGVLVIVSGFLALGWWQINRAAQGNTLSWGYAVQWPVFAAFVVFLWVVEMRRAVRRQDAETTGTTDADTVTAQRDAPVRPATAAVNRRRPRNEAAYDDSGDPTLAEYNHYLSWLNANPQARPADYPGMT
jgi:hypothetical protein